MIDSTLHDPVAAGPDRTFAVPEDRYVVKDYDLATPFASFLPGIAGEEGRPLWAFYANRGQCLASFGREGKHAPIMEFKPADQAYRDLPTQGFRTFVRLAGGTFFEAFGPRGDEEQIERTMSIGPADLRIEERRPGWHVVAEYAIVADETFPGILRRVTVTNEGDGPANPEILDGFPRIVPFGIADHPLKVMSTTAAAWIETDVSDPYLPAYRIRASIDDTVDVRPVREANFYLPSAGRNEALRAIVDPAAVFGPDKSFGDPGPFRRGGLAAVAEATPQLIGVYPSAFAGTSASLEPGESIEVRSLFGTVADLGEISGRAAELTGGRWMAGALEASRACVGEVMTGAYMKTARPALDAYTRQTMLDNVLRGGQPRIFSGGGIYRLYGRKHGDMERDYNDFSVPAEPFSNGFGNYRDVNQNRRMDVAFEPRIGTSVIREFVNLLQVDGYNPLIVRPGVYRLEDGRTVGLAELLDELGGDRKALDSAISTAEYQPEAFFGEGYWVDHWTYNLDLIEEYLRIFPDWEHELFFGSRDYSWSLGERRVVPFEKRFGEPCEEMLEPCEPGTWAVEASLFERLFALAAVKAATLGPAASGIEMEAGRPGWYDALNGLPGLLGVSLSDSAELLRLARILLRLAERYPGESVSLPLPVETLWTEMLPTLAAVTPASWVARWKARDRFRDSLSPVTPPLVSGTAVYYRDGLTELSVRLAERLDAAARDNGGLLPTYRRYVADELLVDGGPTKRPVRPIDLPLFLEGVVKQLRLGDSPDAAAEVYRLVKDGPLYDRGLSMYRLNEDLCGQPGTLGRATAFPHGWLENGSIWLHMEYKYLLELLKAGLGERFWTEATNCLIPFQPPERYGRSIYENSSFIASTSYPDASVHGKGFVARLSGATAEFMTMWHHFLLGKNPFSVEADGRLRFRPEPILPAWLFNADGELEFALFGKTLVTYRNVSGRDLFSGAGPVAFHGIRDGVEDRFGEAAVGGAAERIRDGYYERIVAEF